MSTLISLVMLLSGVSTTGCVVVDGDRIRALDFAPHIPLFAKLDPGTILAFAPNPGVRRIFGSQDLARLAHVTSTDGMPESICVERRAAQLTSSLVERALRDSLTRAGFSASTVELEVIDFIRAPLPSGQIEFPLTGLVQPSNPFSSVPLLWRGRVLSDANRSVPIWARVRLRTFQKGIVALRDLASGALLQAGDIGERLVAGLPRFTQGPVSVESFLGRQTRRAIRQGDPVDASVLAQAEVVKPGDKVAVRVASGASVLKFYGIAETRGRTGAKVIVKNPVTGRRFQAVVESSGQVAVRLEDKGA